MDNIAVLNELYHQYVKGSLDRKEFEGRIFSTILKNAQYFYFTNWGKDEYVDYLCWLYPRLHNAIDNYREKGYSFSTHIAALIRFSTKEYRSRQVNDYITEFAAWTVHTADMEVHSQTPGYLTEPDVEMDQPGSTEKSALQVSGRTAETAKTQAANMPLDNPRQVLLLLLKSYYFVSDDFLERIAPAIGMETEKLREMIEKLRLWRTRRDENIETLRERIVCQFYRCIVFEKRLCTVTEGTIQHERLTNSLKRARERLSRMRRRLAGIRVDATNQQVADLLGITKGAVASNLYALRNRTNKPKPDPDEDPAPAPVKAKR